jgi:prolyl-tRNA editing enzyme YbaK/EbsC (Cys-tRNA(Pro) deacylase)
MAVTSSARCEEANRLAERLCGGDETMSLASVRAFLAERAPDIEILEATTSTATVALAAAAHGVEPARIAKTLSLRLGGEAILIVMGGEARLDNRKYKDRFAAKAKMLDAAEVLEATSHPVGGVCPFGLPRPLRVYADVSLRAFDVVVPAAGDAHTALRIAPQRLAELADAEWIDVAQG